MKGYSFRSLTDLVLKIFKTKVNAGTGLSGGGSLEADRTLSVKYGTTAGTAAQGNDSRITGAFQTSQVVQVTGTSATNVMSQKAVTDTINTKTTSLRENIKVTVGAGGDFTTINAAVLHLSRFTPDLGVTAEVELRRGFVMREQLIVKGLDLGWITIAGVDAETVINEPSLTRVLYDNEKPAFGVINGTLPTIGQLFSFSSKGALADRRSGVIAHSVGRVVILDGCGVKNAGYNGFQASRSSTIDANGANASGAGLNGLYAADCSTINALNAIASGAGINCIYANQASIINALYANASGSGSMGCRADQGSTINTTYGDASGAAAFGFHIDAGSIISASGATGTLIQAANAVTSRGIIFQYTG